MTVSHEWPALTDLSGTPSHSATIRDVLLPSIKGRLEVQVYAATSSLPAAGDFSGQLAAVGSAAPYTYFSWTGAAWRVFGVPEFATTGARDAIITAPQANDRCRVGSGTTWTEYTHTGSAWTAGAWTSYTPTWTGLSLGNGSVVAAYSITNKRLDVRIVLTFGSTTTISGVFYPSLPAGAVPTSFAPMPGYGFDSSATTWVFLAFVQSAYILTPTAGRCTATVPWTWTAGDTITIGGSTEIS